MDFVIFFFFFKGIPRILSNHCCFIFPKAKFSVRLRIKCQTREHEVDCCRDRCGAWGSCSHQGRGDCGINDIAPEKTLSLVGRQPYVLISQRWFLTFPVTFPVTRYCCVQWRLTENIVMTSRSLPGSWWSITNTTYNQKRWLDSNA